MRILILSGLAVIGCTEPTAPTFAADATAVVVEPVAPVQPAPPHVFPEPQFELRNIAAVAPPNFGARRVFIDAGHGTKDNHGAQTIMCGHEAEFALTVANDLAKRLRATGHFRATVSRKSGSGPSYRRRLQAAEAARADVLLSIHADVRGMASAYELSPGQWCLRNPEQAGFGILVSDEGSPALESRRRTLARAIATSMSKAGFLAYDGFDYGGLYENDTTAGVFLDRRRLFMLRKPKMPSVIVETHHALHPQDYARWQEPETREAFARAVIAALYSVLQEAE